MSDAALATTLAQGRKAVRSGTLADEAALVSGMIETARLDEFTRASIASNGAEIVRRVRAASSPGLMETFLAEYGLSTDEGIALMCLAEALLRVPDADTIDALIEDKIAPSDWGKHLGQSSSSLVNASTWALLLTGRVLDDERPGLAAPLRGAIKRLGEPVIRAAVAEAMRRLGKQFVLGETIGSGLKRATRQEEKGYAYSYDMLGEAARTFADAERYRIAYQDAIDAIAKRAVHGDVVKNPGISIKLSALHPRYEYAHREACVPALIDSVLGLAKRAAAANMGLNIDAEEQDRLDLSLDIIEAVARDPALDGWDGFGVVVQAYGRRSPAVIEWLDALAADTARRIMVRLVKGAYWDTEIKRAQVMGVPGFPVFTRKAATDVCYLGCARMLLDRAERLYPQFATHNAHTVSAVMAMADGEAYEFQRLHGMGEALYEVARADHNVPCRIYAPVGAHEDLLAYLVRRLLENGANSSFANQLVDHRVEPEAVASDPISAVLEVGVPNEKLRQPPALYGASRPNAEGWDLFDTIDTARFEAARSPFRGTKFFAEPIVAVADARGETSEVINPADASDLVGHVTDLAPGAAAGVIEAAAAGVGWADGPGRAAVLRQVADLYEANAGKLFALAAREAGKIGIDVVAELREAVDFLRYYANAAEALDGEPAGVWVAISPWNFPLAIFTGQIAASLAAGNAVVAKPAVQTPLIAAAAVKLFHKAGVPLAALQLCPGGGAVGAALTSQPGLAGVGFTGSTATAKVIDRQLAKTAPDAILVAETGGLNAMIVDSTALPEQAVRDIVVSAFQSAGQRCSALRVLYVQKDVAERTLTMLKGAMAALVTGAPWDLATDVGPVIDTAAKAKIAGHIEKHRAKVIASEGRADGLFVPPSVIKVGGIEELEEEVFGPVLHVATFEADQIGDVIEAINGAGYGLTFGLHTRIDDRVEDVVGAVKVGNCYVNRNQIGAIVGSQPFGGEGLSGTGPKAGGPLTVPHLTKRARPNLPEAAGPAASREAVQGAIDAVSAEDRVLEFTDMPGPTGESNRLTLHPRGVVICAGPGLAAAERQAKDARADGNGIVMVAPGAKGAPSPHFRAVDGVLSTSDFASLSRFAGVVYDGQRAAMRAALAEREGAIIPLVSSGERLVLERHLCIDTTAAGGNAKLLSSTEEDPLAA
ncbi:MAG: bifunctional proline dehydrogenase/L-glutamate gamma-semialdehyde dehydrogenase PutA [Pseudomonadota bacterium]